MTGRRTQRAMTEQSRDSMAEVLSAFAFASDLAFGLAHDDSIRSCYLAVRIADRLECSAAEQQTVYYTALLKDAGCTSFNSTLASFWGADEIAARRELLIFGGTHSTAAFVRWLVRYVGPGLPPHRRVARAVDVARHSRTVMMEGFTAARDIAMRIAGRLGMSDDVVQATCSIFERWDGTGMPDRLRGEAIPLAARVAHPTFTLAPVASHLGRDAAIALARRERGAAFDPDVADAFLDLATKAEFWADLEGPALWKTVLEREPATGRAPLSEERLDQVALALADFTDLKAPHVLAHSRRTAAVAEALARALGCPDATVADVRRAALVHDIGLVAVPSWVLAKPEDRLTAGEREQLRLHSYHVERVLSRVPALARLADLAGYHHERQDGSGYFRGLSGTQISLASSIVAVAAHFDEVTHEAPGRAALTREQALAALDPSSGAAFPPAVVRALPAALGLPTAGQARAKPPPGAGPALTEREVEVLRLAARGLTRREIGRRLRVTEHTVRHHLEHIYDKAGVSNRVSATLFAMEQGLLD